MRYMMLDPGAVRTMEREDESGENFVATRATAQQIIELSIAQAIVIVFHSHQHQGD